jgi:HlyD family secretion protein
VVNYNTVVAVDNPELKLRPGMTATVSILVARRDQALKIPKAALRFQPKLSEREREDLEKYVRERQDKRSRDGATPVAESQRRRWQAMPKVWMLTPEGFVRPITVRLGISDDHFTELLGDGLQEGQELVTGMMDQDGGGGASRPSTTSAPPRLRF